MKGGCFMYRRKIDEYLLILSALIVLFSAILNPWFSFTVSLVLLVLMLVYVGIIRKRLI
jgi:hypothetical protein